MCVFGVALQTCIPLHQKCQQYFWIPSMGVFEMHTAKRCVFLGWRPKHAYLCTKYSISSVFECCVVYGCVGNAQCRKVCVFGVPPPTRIPMHEYSISSVFECLVWWCLKCTMPKRLRSWPGAPNAHTYAPNHPPAVFLDTWYGCV